tara:strand:+ start:126 stop:686 length:561 start_codon:yes stop_codon:yes gene_type:complete
MGFLVYQDYDMRNYVLAALAALFCSPASEQVSASTAVPSAAPVSVSITCDAQYPGSPPLPVLDAGKCYFVDCVNAAQSAHSTSWADRIKAGRDVVCDLQASADYWNGQATYFSNLAAQEIPLCYGGDLEACRLMDHYLAEEQEAIDQADAFLVLVATFTTALDLEEADIDEDFIDAILSCIYPCNN